MTEHADDLSFCVDRIEIPVTLFKKTPDPANPDQIIEVETKYILVEMDGAARDRWLTNISKRSEVVKDGKSFTTRITSFEKADAQTLCGSLLLLPNRLAVSVDDIHAMPSRVTSKLADKLREISGLNDDEEPAKNDSTGRGMTGLPLPNTSENPSPELDAK